MTVREFAAREGVHINTVYQWAKKGWIPCTVKRCRCRVRIMDIPEFTVRPPVRPGPGGEPEGLILDKPPWL